MPSTVVDYTLSNTPPVAINLDPALSNTAPVAVDLTPALTGANATEISPLGSLSNTPPDAITVGAALSNTPPTAITVGAALSDTPPDTISPGSSPVDAAAVPRPINGIDYATLPALPIMPANFAPAFVELTGGGPSLASLSVSSADLNRIVQGTVGGELKSYQVRAGTDAQALPGIVRPANYDGSTNALVFIQL